MAATFGDVTEGDDEICPQPWSRAFSMSILPTAFGICALAGYLTERSLRAAPPGLPTVRRFQAAQAEVSRRWLATLL